MNSFPLSKERAVGVCNVYFYLSITSAISLYLNKLFAVFSKSMIGLNSKVKFSQPSIVRVRREVNGVV